MELLYLLGIYLSYSLITGLFLTEKELINAIVIDTNPELKTNLSRRIKD